jgi:hypothetical protein
MPEYRGTGDVCKRFEVMGLGGLGENTTVGFFEEKDVFWRVGVRKERRERTIPAKLGGCGVRRFPKVVGFFLTRFFSETAVLAFPNPFCK